MDNENALLNRSSKLTVIIDYEDFVRSIDLENILSGFRMILQHELAERTGLGTRTFTDVTKIESIEKGSIEINMLFDLVNLNINLIEINVDLLSIDIDLSDIIKLYLMANLKNVPKTLLVHIEGIKSALRHIRSLTLKTEKNKTEFRQDQDGDIKVIKQ